MPTNVKAFKSYLTSYSQRFTCKNTSPELSHKWQVTGTHNTNSPLAYFLFSSSRSRSWLQSCRWTEVSDRGVWMARPRWAESVVDAPEFDSSSGPSTCPPDGNIRTLRTVRAQLNAYELNKLCFPKCHFASVQDHQFCTKFLQNFELSSPFSPTIDMTTI